MSASECAGSVESSSIFLRGLRTASRAANADETVVLPTPPLPMKNESSATETFYVSHALFLRSRAKRGIPTICTLPAYKKCCHPERLLFGAKDLALSSTQV